MYLAVDLELGGKTMWQKPKTNWTIDDYINADDYNRIIGNLTYIIQMAKRLYQPIAYDQPVEKAVDRFPYADEFNYIEEILDTLENSTYPFSEFARGYWIDNGPTPTYDDMNRIESACYAFYDGYSRQEKQNLSIRLGCKPSTIRC